MKVTTETDTHALFKRAAAIVAASLGFGLAFDIFFFDQLPGISFPLYILLVLAGVFVSARYFKRHIPQHAVLLMLPLLFFSGMVAVRASGFITFLNFAMSCYLLALMLYAIYRPNIRTYTLVHYLEPLYELPIRCVKKLGQTLGELVAVRSLVRKHQALPQILRGVLIALPVLLLFVGLFASADLVFRKVVGDLFSFHVNEAVVAHTFWVLLVTAVFVGVFGYLASKENTQEAPAAQAEAIPKKPRGAVEAVVLFGSLNALFLMFIVVQLAYFFGGEQNVLGQGITYAEYARKGFFELITVAVLSFLLILAAERMLRGPDGKHDKRFRLLAAGLTVQVLVIMASAFQRLSLYESAYGFTTLRALSHLFIIWLAAVFCMLLYKLFVDQRESTFAFAVFVSVIALLAIINVANIDAFVARKNIGRYYSTHRLDVGYLGELSDDAILETTKLLDGPDPKLRDALAGTLYQKRFDLQEKNGGWQSFNLTRHKALNALNAKLELLERNQDKRVEGLSRPVDSVDRSVTD